MLGTRPAAGAALRPRLPPDGAAEAHRGAGRPRRSRPGRGCARRLYDTHRRLLFEETRPWRQPSEDLRRHPAELRSQGLEWEVATLGPQGQMDISTAACYASRRATGTASGSPVGAASTRGAPSTSTRRCAPRVEALVDVAFNGITENGTGKTWLNLWHNIGYSDLGLLSYMGKDVPDFMETGFAEKATKYAPDQGQAVPGARPLAGGPGLARQGHGEHDPARHRRPAVRRRATTTAWATRCR